jgi:hypothetical protein
MDYQKIHRSHISTSRWHRTVGKRGLDDKLDAHCKMLEKKLGVKKK